MTSAFAALLLALSFLVPDHALPWDTFRSQAVAALALGIAGIGVLRASTLTAARWHWPPVSLLPLLLAPIPWLQWLTGQVSFMADALLPCLYLLGAALSIGIGSQWARVDEEGALCALALALLLAGIASVGVAIFQWLALAPPPFTVQMPPGFRPGANLAQPNHLATLLLMAMATAMLGYEKRWIGGVGLAVAFAWLSLGLVISQSRAAALSAALLWTLALTLRTRANLRLARVPMVVALGCVLGVVALWDPANQWLHLTGPQMADRIQVGSRSVLWRVVWDAVWLHPWAGYGWNQVAMAQLLVAPGYSSTGALLQSSHNLLLDLWIWIGVPLGSVAAAVLAIWFCRRWAACRDGTTFTLLAAITAVLVHAMFEYPLEQAFFLLPLALMIGLIDGRSRVAAAFTTVRAVPAVALLAFVVVMARITSEYLDVESGLRQARLGLLGFNNRFEIVAPPAVLLLDGPREYHRLMVTTPRTQMSRSEVDWMRRVTERYPFAPALYRYSLAAGLNGQPDAASLTLTRLCAIHTPARCNEGRIAWTNAQQSNSALSAIVFPLRNQVHRSEHASHPSTRWDTPCSDGQEPHPALLHFVA
jgi:O-antigen ligase